MGNPLLTPSKSALISEVLRAAERFSTVAKGGEVHSAALRLVATGLRRAAEELEMFLLESNEAERKRLHGGTKTEDEI